MKNVLFILVCLFTSQAFGQQQVKTNNPNTRENRKVEANEAQIPQREITNTLTCSIEGVKIIVTKKKYNDGHDDGQRLIGVTGLVKTFYADQHDLTVSIAPGLGVPGPSDPIFTTNSFYDKGNPGYLRIEYIAPANSNKTYCDEDGNKIKNSSVYKISIGSHHQEYDGDWPASSDASQYDSYNYVALAHVYNQNKQPQNSSIPETCHNCDCAPDVVVGPSKPDVGPTTWVDASGVKHDWFRDTINTGAIGGNPVIGGNILHERISLVAGVVSNSFGDDVGNSGYVNQGIGAHLGVYVPVTNKHPVSVGVYVSGDYLASNKDGFRHEPAGFEVNGMPSTVKASSNGKIKQSLMMLGAGPQVNVGLGRKISLCTIIQGGVASFKQSGFSFIQEFKEGDMAIPVEIFNQQETKTTSFFWTPRIKVMYAITSKIGIWADGSYMMSNIEANQSRLNPGEPRNDDGKYSFGQVNSASQLEKINKYKLKGAGIGAGVRFSLSN